MFLPNGSTCVQICCAQMHRSLPFDEDGRPLTLSHSLDPKGRTNETSRGIRKRRPSRPASFLPSFLGPHSSLGTHSTGICLSLRLPLSTQCVGCVCVGGWVCGCPASPGDSHPIYNDQLSQGEGGTEERRGQRKRGKAKRPVEQARGREGGAGEWGEGGGGCGKKEGEEAFVAERTADGRTDGQFQIRKDTT